CRLFSLLSCLSFFTATAPSAIYTLSLHDALPIYVLLRVERRHQVVELEHEADVVTAPVRQLSRAHGVDALAVDLDLPAAGRVQPTDQVEQRGLAGAGRAHQRDEIAFRDFQVDAVQHFDLLRAALVALGEVAD